MPFVPRGTEFTFRQAVKGVLGFLATSFSFVPGVAKLLHAWRGVRFTDRASVFLGLGVVLDNRFPELIEIGRDVWLTGHTKVACHSNASRLQRERFRMREQVDRVVLHDGVFVGVNSVLLPGTVLGEGCYVQPNSVVSGEFPPGVLIAGVPARIVRSLGTPGTDVARPSRRA